MEQTYTRKAIATRNRIIDEAATLFFSKGFGRSKLEEVLEASQVQKGNFYYYFKSKDDLALAVLRERGKKMLVEWFSTLADPAEDPWHNIENMATRLAGCPELIDSRDNQVICMSLELIELSDELREVVGEIVDAVVAYFAQEFERLAEQGRLKGDKTPQELATFSFCFLQGAILNFKATRSEPSLHINLDLGMNELERHVKLPRDKKKGTGSPC